MKAPVPPPRLPIEHIRTRFLDAAAAADSRIVLSAPTGSGKSTTVPQWLESLADGAGRGPVVVLEPRRVACISLARYLASLRNERVGESVGYRVRFDERYSDATRILFVTPGMLLRLLASDGFAKNGAPSAVVLDEFHERGADADLCAALLLARQDPTSGPRLVFASATLDVAAVHQKVGGTVLSAPGRTYPITVEHMDAPPSPSARDLEQRVASAVHQALRAHPGDILVFLPGGREISSAQRALGAVNAEVLTLHGGRDPDAVVAALTPGSRRRVYLSTNVAETSLTLPGVRVVIDSGLERGIIHVQRRVALALVPSAGSSLEQRKGRAGRVAEGHCMRLFSAGYAPAPQRDPELLRIELDETVVRAAALGVSASALASLPFITPPPDFALTRAHERLSALGLLDDEGALSPRGRQALRFGVRTELGAALLAAPSDVRPLLAAAVALSETTGALLRPLNTVAPAQRDDVGELRAQKLAGAHGPFDEAVRALTAPHPQKLGVHRVRLEAAKKLYARLSDVPLSEVPRHNTVDARRAVALHLARHVPHAGYLKRARAASGRGQREAAERERAPYGNDNDEIILDAYRAPGADDAVQPEAAVVLDTRFIQDERGRVRGFGGLYLRCSPEVLREAGLGVIEYGAPHVRGRGESLRIEADAVWTFAGASVPQARVRLNGAALIDALAVALMAGRLLDGVSERLPEAIFHWRLAHAMGAPKAPPAEDETAFLRARLSELGVERASDLALVDADDVVPDVAERCGDAMIFAQVQRDFPHRLRLEGFSYRSEVNPVRKEVTLVFERQKKGHVPKQDPPARLVPRFAGFRVFVQRASRRVKVR